VAGKSKSKNERAAVQIVVADRSQARPLSCEPRGDGSSCCTGHSSDSESGSSGSSVSGTGSCSRCHGCHG
jgi:hypothetical protein